MNIKKYEAFVRAVELGSLTKAAVELGYTQSGISHMMQSLEEELGFALMVRTSSGILPNPEGELLLPVIRQLLGTNETLEQCITKIRGADTGRVRIAALPGVAAYWLPRILRTFQKDFPNVEIHVMEGSADAIEEMMDHREADLCIYNPGEAVPFEWEPLYRDPMVALLPPDHPLAGALALPLDALMQECFLMPMAGYDREVRRILNQLEQYPRIRFSACSDRTIISMVEAGLGVSILPALLVENHSSCAAVVPLNPPQYRMLGMGVPQLKTASPATRNFMEYIKRDVQQKGRSGEQDSMLHKS